MRAKSAWWKKARFVRFFFTQKIIVSPCMGSFATSVIPKITLMKQVCRLFCFILLKSDLSNCVQPDHTALASSGKTELQLFFTNPSEDDLTVELVPLSETECRGQQFAYKLVSAFLVRRCSCDPLVFPAVGYAGVSDEDFWVRRPEFAGRQQ